MRHHRLTQIISEKGCLSIGRRKLDASGASAAFVDPLELEQHWMRTRSHWDRAKAPDSPFNVAGNSPGTPPSPPPAGPSLSIRLPPEGEASAWGACVLLLQCCLPVLSAKDFLWPAVPCPAVKVPRVCDLPAFLSNTNHASSNLLKGGSKDPKHITASLCQEN